MEDAALKQVLLSLVDEVENLMASQAVLALFSPAPPTIEVARIAKGQASKDAERHFGKLRQQIEELASE